jgi:hypothetical protein
MTRRRLLTLHVGTPKSGTTYLQGLLGRNRKQLREVGLLYPGRRPSHFLEAMGVREAGFRGHTYDNAPQAWAKAVEAIRGHDGPALLSHESLGGSKREVIERVVATFPDHEIRVVVTCRDLGRQLPAVWQEKVKNGDAERYEPFLDKALDRWDGLRTLSGMWRSQNLAAIGRRWAKVVGTDHVSFVTVPLPGAEHNVLWDRFRQAVGIPDAAFEPLPDVRNPSLGAVETELLRRLTEQLPEDLPWPQHSRKVKRRFAERELTQQQQAGGPLIVPADRRPRFDEISAAMVDAVRENGYPVIGDLAELTPTYRDNGMSADAVTDAQLLERTLQLMVPLVLRDDDPDEQPQK